jgi:hypothetical protein
MRTLKYGAEFPVGVESSCNQPGNYVLPGKRRLMRQLNPPPIITHAGVEMKSNFCAVLKIFKR